MFRDADRALADFNYDTFKQLITNLRRKGFIAHKTQYSKVEIEITELGKKRIASLFPIYRTGRQWDGFLYLISYDIPEIKRVSRELLRRYLRKIGCALLQESLWITPYTPRKLLHDFMYGHSIQGTVLLSKLGKNSAIGEERLEDLLEKVYRLSALNDRYTKFIFRTHEKIVHPLALAVEFQGILIDDPQLPFPLLPDDWKGNEAFAAYTAIYKRSGGRNK